MSASLASYLLKSNVLKLREGFEQDPVVAMLDDILCKGIEAGVSDIHLEPSLASEHEVEVESAYENSFSRNRLKIRYRIDGLLSDQGFIYGIHGLQLVSRIKILSSLDIAQQRMPQDGRLILSFVEDVGQRARDIDVRISTFPTIYGEKVVLRILDNHGKKILLEDLGCSDSILLQINRLIEFPHGFFLVTGPTGSGKTTTLYAILSKLNRPERNIVTMEDPVEYKIEGITQSQINEKIQFSFECGLRSLLRQDPDVAMVGEVRDRQAAQIAIEAALTGHLVLSTLHTNDSIGAITRLLDMGIEPFFITASLTGVLAQRLVGRLCFYCKYEDALTDDEKCFIEKHGWELDRVWRASGCERCRYLGSKGRVGLFELFIIDDQIRSFVMQGVEKVVIKQYAKQQGMIFLIDDGIEKVKQGMITLAEACRVIGW